MGALSYRQTLAALQKIRKNKGLSQTEFATRFGVSPYSVINFENGRSDRFRTAMLYFRTDPVGFVRALEGENGTDI